MSDNPMSRLPRPESKAPAARAIPVPARPLSTTAVAERAANVAKRKAPSTAAPTAKRAVTGRPAVPTHTMTTRRSSGGSSTSSTTRKPPVPKAAPVRAPARQAVAKAPARAPARPAGPSRAEPIADNRMANMESMLEALKAETEKISATQRSLAEKQALQREAEARELEARRGLSATAEEIREMRDKHLREVDELERQILKKEREKAAVEDELKEMAAKLDERGDIIRSLRQQLSETDNKHMDLAAKLTAAEKRNEELQTEVERATIAVSAMKAELETKQQEARNEVAAAEERILAAHADRDERVAAMEAELRNAETIRRKLHNMVQELKGNIRVFARVRPPLPHETDALANITYGDERLAAETGQSHLTVVSRSESAMGKEREQVQHFTFDKVFQPHHGQQDVFEEISMLAQSVLDGYNVCIFAYGQTGSGKSWTMEGGDTPATCGMIPRAIDMIFNVSKQLRDRGWKYEMEGTFLEVYNDVINDLLGTSQFDSKKHEIKIDKDRMTVTDVVSLPLSNPQEVSILLERARSRRAVAATLMNERSSRSHSVFALKIRGTNAETGESSEGILNLVDLAGSERLASSGAGENKDRLKETININKSLSALADVISALGAGQQGGHVPYRNSTLTRLLQTSLSGSSKTLMLCNLSPLAAHLGETVCTLRFATKVNSTPAGPARRSLGKTV